MDQTAQDTLSSREARFEAFNVKLGPDLAATATPKKSSCPHCNDKGFFTLRTYSWDKRTGRMTAAINGPFVCVNHGDARRTPNHYA